MEGPPLGPPTSFTPLLPIAPFQLHGKYVDIIPLQLSHAEELYNAIGGPENAYLWTYITTGPFLTLESFVAHFSSRLSLHTYGVLLKSSNRIVGTVSAEPNSHDGVLTSGEVILSPEVQSSPGSTEIWLLMFGALFKYGFRRVEWRCDSNNSPSRKTGLRLGFKYEGRLRQHQVVKGRNRDTDCMSMLDVEWDVCRAAIEKWISSDNFDDEGRQLRGLREIREEMLGIKDCKKREKL